MIYVYNYQFESSTYNKITRWSMIEGGSKIGTTRSSGWLFDGQVFTRTKDHPYFGKYDEPKIVKVYC